MTTPRRRRTDQRRFDWAGFGLCLSFTLIFILLAKGCS